MADARARHSSVLYTVQTPPNLILSVPRDHSAGVKWGEREADHSPSSRIEFRMKGVIPGVQLKSGPYFNMSNLFTKIYNMLHYTNNLYLQ
jgi:hypothetical protein